MGRLIFAASATAVGLALASPGFAQAADDPQATQPDPGPVADEEGEDPNEIVVTARKREETLQDVPAAVSVATAETIERLGLDSLTDIAKTTPGLVFDDSFGRDANRPVIRGQANILGQSGVAYFIDGIYFPGSIADYDVDTIARIEVVKGPQSALYGRNTYSGAINIISKLPTDRIEGRAALDVSEHNRYELTAGVRGPIGGGFGFGINGRLFRFGGEYTNLYDGKKVGKQESKSISGVLSFDRDDLPFKAVLRVAHNRTDDGQPALFAQSANLNNCLFDNGTLYAGRGRYFCGTIKPQRINTDYRRQFIDAEDVGLEATTTNVSFRVDWDLGGGFTLSSLTGYNKRHANVRTDGDYSAESFQTVVFSQVPTGPALPIAGPRNRNVLFIGSINDFSFATRTRTRDASQEIRLTYESDTIDAIVGGYVFDQDDDSQVIRDVPADAAARAIVQRDARVAALCAANPICANPIATFTLAADDRTETLFDVTNKAIFGAVTWHITPTVNLSVEGRYASERVRQEIFAYNETQVRPTRPTQSSRTFKSFTPRITADWQINPDHLAYAIYAEGQKPGGFNGAQAIVAGRPAYDPEDNKSWELGLKNRFFDGRLILNLAAFHTEIKGYQLTQNISVPPNQVSIVANAGNARINGLELEARARPLRGVNLTFNYALADGEFTKGFDENQGVLNDVADNGLVDCSIGDQFPLTTGCQSLYGSIKGKSIPRAPKHTLFGDIDYRTPVFGSWDFFAGINGTYTSSSYDQVHNLARTGDAFVVDARLGLENDRFRIMGYVKNLTDEDSVQQILRYADVNADLRRNFVAGLRPGRRFGVVLSAGF